MIALQRKIDSQGIQSDDSVEVPDIALPRSVPVSRASKILIATSVAFFLASLTQTGFYLGEENRNAFPGWGIVLMGWLGVISHQNVAWLANPALFFCWLATVSGSRRVAIGFSLTSTLLALSFFLCETMTASAANDDPKFITIGPGYWIWLASIATAFTACVVPFRSAPTPHQSSQ
jgi:hypothetical protein